MDSDDTIIIVLAGTFFVFVMAGHSRLKNGVASLAYGPGHPRSNLWKFAKDVDVRDKRGHDDGVGNSQFGSTAYAGRYRQSLGRFAR